MWADVVPKCHETVILALQGPLRHHDIEVPRVPDVSDVLEEHGDRFPQVVREALEELMETSQELRRDRELAFYGSEDITPRASLRHEFAASPTREPVFRGRVGVRRKAHQFARSDRQPAGETRCSSPGRLARSRHSMEEL